MQETGTIDLGSSGESRAGSSPVIRMIEYPSETMFSEGFFVNFYFVRLFIFKGEI